MKRKNGKKIKKKWLVLITTIVVIAGGVGIVFLRGKNSMAMTLPEGALTASRSVTAEIGTISNTVVGSGNLTKSDAESIDVLSGIKVKEVLVESGDTVTEGDVLAVLDADSISAKMASIQSEINEIDESLEALVEEDDDTQTISSYLSGRVKKIYASAGAAVSDVMVNNGALMVISLNGKLAVDYTPTSSVSVGDEVNVTLSDGAVVTGTIYETSDSSVTVTVSDDGTTDDDTVTITDADGNVLGSGQLYIQQPLEITGTSGTISSVDVSENEEISADETLITLTDIPVSSSYQELTEDRKDLVATLNELITLSKTNTITADVSGTVESVNLTAKEVTGSSSSNSTTGTSGTSGTSGTNGVSGSDAGSNTAAQAVNFSSTLTNTVSGITLLCDTTEETTTASTENSITKLSDLTIEAPKTDESSQNIIEETDEYTGSISWLIGDKELGTDTTFLAETVYTAKVELNAKSGYVFTNTASLFLGINSGEVTEYSLENSNKTLTFYIEFNKTEKIEATAEQETTQANTQAGLTDNGSATGSGDSGTTSGGSGTTSGGSGTISGGSGTTSGGSGTTSGSSTASDSSSLTASSTSTDSSSSTDNSSSSSTQETATAFTITPNDTMSISISVDELDILSLSVGQSVSVTCDALEGETANGEITSISDTGSSSGGVVKYTVIVTIPKSENMMAGMSASATITIEEKTDIVIIPVGALQESGNRVYVYTEADSETNELGGEVEVETGLSDGDYVEIVSGLSEGDTVYYAESTTTDTDTSDFSFGGGGDMDGMSFPDNAGGGGGGGGGQMPDGGGMPGGN